MTMEFVRVTQEWMAARGILPLPDMRKNRAGTEYLLHEDYFVRMGGVADSVPTYAHNSPELAELLASAEWKPGDPDAEQPTQGYVVAAATRNLMGATKAGIQALALTAKEALQLPDMYPNWAPGLDVKAGERYNHGGKLWEVQQAHTTQEGWAPGTATLALFVAVDAQAHAGTRADPIPYVQGMALALGKFYEQDGVVYECIQASGPLVYDLKDVPALARPVEEA